MPQPSLAEFGEQFAAQPKDEVLIDALADGRTYREAGDMLGISERTVARRMESHEFAAAVTARRAAICSERLTSLRNNRLRRTEGATDAVAALRDLLGHDDPHIVLAAAKQLVTANGSGATIELETRLASLEAELITTLQTPLAAPGVRWPR